MINTSHCELCLCPLTINEYEFTGHTPLLCKGLALQRIQTLEKMLEFRNADVAVMRDMMARHECKP